MIKLWLFLMRVVLVVAVIIAVKSLFLCWYLNEWSVDQYINNIFSLNSALLSLGVISGNFMDIVLSKTPLNINLINLLEI
jgi:hypothetical protein